MSTGFSLNRDERQAVVRVDVNDLSIHGFFPPSAAYQEFQRVVTTDDGHGNVDPAERCNDVGRSISRMQWTARIRKRTEKSLWELSHL